MRMPLRRLPGTISALALALTLSFAPSPARADDPPAGGGETYALAPDSAAAPSGPVATAETPSVAADAASNDVKSAILPAAADKVAPTSLQPAPTSLLPASAPKVAPSPTKAAKPERPPATPKKDERSVDEGTRVRAEIDRTERVLRSVKAKVVRSFNKKAREEFERAAGLQDDARASLGENFFARAARLTQESRQMAREIAVHLGPPQDDPDYVAMTLDRTDDAIGRAREVLRDAGGETERGRLSALEERQKEARRLHREGSTRGAYAATIDVRDGILTLLRDCDDLPVPAATAEKALKRATRALDQAKGELGERVTAAAARLARDARAQMEKARAAFARKNYRDTLLHSKLVERDIELAVSAQRGATSRSG
jgi:hypothetical protein